MSLCLLYNQFYRLVVKGDLLQSKLAPLAIIASIILWEMVESDVPSKINFFCNTYCNNLLVCYFYVHCQVPFQVCFSVPWNCLLLLCYNKSTDHHFPNEHLMQSLILIHLPLDYESQLVATRKYSAISIIKNVCYFALAIFL